MTHKRAVIKQECYINLAWEITYKSLGILTLAYGSIYYEIDIQEDN